MWLMFGKSSQEAAEGEEVAAAVVMAETPNPATGMSCSPVTSRPCDSEGSQQRGAVPPCFWRKCTSLSGTEVCVKPEG